MDMKILLVDWDHDTIIGFADNSLGIVGGQGIDILYGSEIDYLRYDLEEIYQIIRKCSGVKVNCLNKQLLIRMEIGYY